LTSTFEHAKKLGTVDKDQSRYQYSLENMERFEIFDQPAYPSSPKSVFRLANFWNLDSLEKLALHQIKAELTVETAVREAVSPLSKVLDEVRKEAVSFLTENWVSLLLVPLLQPNV
jgi:hypothetical protein